MKRNTIQNWKDIDINFTEKLQKEWESKRFNYEQTKEWIEVGLQISEASYAKWLRDTKKVDAKWVLDYGNNEQLRKEYWHSKGFTDEEISSWIRVGLGLQDSGYAAWMRDILEITPKEYSSHLDEDNNDKLLREQHQAFLEERKPREVDVKRWKNIHPNFTPELVAEWEENGFIYEEVEQWISMAELQPTEVKFAQWLKAKPTNPQLILAEIGVGIKGLREEYGNYSKVMGYTKQIKLKKPNLLGWKNQSPVNAQEWLDRNYPKERRKMIKNLDIGNRNLEGGLRLEGFVNLEKFSCQGNYLTDLDVSECSQLAEFSIHQNFLTDFDFNSLNPKKLALLSISDNLLSERDLNCFSPFVNLDTLHIGCFSKRNERWARWGAYNHFYGSLEPLKNLTKLVTLNISDTDVDSGLEYLPKSVGIIICENFRGNARVAKIQSLLEPFSSEDGLGKYYNFTVWKGTSPKIREIMRKAKSGNTSAQTTGLLNYKGFGHQSNSYNKIAWNNNEFAHNLYENLLNLFVKSEKEETETENNIIQEIPNEWEDEVPVQNDERDKDLVSNDQVDENNQRINLTDTITKQPTLEHLIGKGGFGEVYYGKWKSQDVAVKKLYLSPHNISESDLKKIREETDILKNLRSRYIIQYYGTYSDEQEILIIMEYAENGTLTKFINGNKDKEHDWKLNNEFIRQMASGLSYIHSENIIHRDLKSLNILLTKNYEVRISDFGLSRSKIVSSTQTKDVVKGTLRWIAPELLKGGKHSEQSDIYALGMVTWEIVAKCTTPFKDVDNNLLGFRIISGGKETIPNDTPKNIHDIIEQCWNDNPSERITLKDILEKVKNDSLSFQTTYPSHLLETQKSEEIGNQSHNGLTNVSSFESSLLKMRFIDESNHCSTELNFDIDSKEPISRTKRQLSTPSQTNTAQGDSKSIKLDELTEEPMEIDENQLQAQIQIPPK